MVGAPNRLAGADIMPARDVAEFVGDDALKPVDVVGVLDKPRINKHILSAASEGIDLRRADEDDLHRCGRQPGGEDERARDVLEQRLGFCVAQDLLGAQGGCQRRRDGGQYAEAAREGRHRRHVRRLR